MSFVRILFCGLMRIGFVIEVCHSGCTSNNIVRYQKTRTDQKTRSESHCTDPDTEGFQCSHRMFFPFVVFTRMTLMRIMSFFMSVPAMFHCTHGVSITETVYRI